MSDEMDRPPTYRVVLRIIDDRGIDFQNPDNPEFATADEAIAALAALPLCTSPYRDWVATRTDWAGRGWTRVVIAEHKVVLARVAADGFPW